MSSTGTAPQDPRGGARLAAVVAAVAAGGAMLGHAAFQGIGAFRFWLPCWQEGYASDACSYLQYEVPSPDWLLPLWVWAVEVALAVVVVVAASRAGARVGLAVAALICVLASSLVVDYSFTPMFNGGFTSADSPPGFGLIGAVAMAAAGVLLLLTVIPRRAAPAPA